MSREDKICMMIITGITIVNLAMIYFTFLTI